jgi:hypothetical protein
MHWKKKRLLKLSSLSLTRSAWTENRAKQTDEKKRNYIFMQRIPHSSQVSSRSLSLLMMHREGRGTEGTANFEKGCIVIWQLQLLTLSSHHLRAYSNEMKRAS